MPAFQEKRTTEDQTLCFWRFGQRDNGLIDELEGHKIMKRLHLFSVQEAQKFTAIISTQDEISAKWNANENSYLQILWR